MACDASGHTQHKFLYARKDLSLLLESDNDRTDERQKSFSDNDSISPKNASSFDLLLTNLWEQAMSNGMFRYQLSKNCLPFKVMPGKFNFIAQLNPDRAQKRRKPQEIQSVNQPFNPHEFHFNKVDPKEILMSIEPSLGSSSTETAEEHSVLINVSPLEYCHVLLTPFRKQCRPQGLTRESLRLAVELCLLSNSSDFRVGFNSLCGFASVNHEHYHAYYLSYRLFIEYAPLVKIPTSDKDDHWFQLKDPCYPPGLCMVLTDLKENCIVMALNSIIKLAEYFQKNDVGHNLYITRGSTENIKGHFDSVRIFVWARKSSFGSKACDAFNPALCELAGHLPIKSEKAYQDLDEDHVLKELHEICDEPFEKVREWMIS